ncbi:MAG: hypothetical protein ACI837_003198 [Crocinitomicaceae bacterium]|jgi:hypothetical protein
MKYTTQHRTMTKKLLFAFIGICLFTTNQVQAQCSSCTITISGTEILPQIVPVGVKLCITATGDLQGALLINGGEVCNEGSISSNGITLLDGTLTSTGTITSVNFAITAGTVDHQGISTIDSIGILGDYVDFNNSGTITSAALGITKTGPGLDPTVTNSGTWTMNNLGVYVGGVMNNTGNLIVSNDFGNFAAGTTTNSGYMSVGNDFGNTGDFYTDCIIPVGNDWGNDGVITGPMTGGCGGFNVTGISANAGDFAIDNSFLDMCPVFTLNTGTLGSNVTICSCTNTCLSTVSINSDELNYGVTLYPNPFSESATLTIENFQLENYTLSIYNVQGQLVREITDYYVDPIIIEQGNLSRGVFYYTVKTNLNTIASGKLVVN